MEIAKVKKDFKIAKEGLLDFVKELKTKFYDIIKDNSNAFKNGINLCYMKNYINIQFSERYKNVLTLKVSYFDYYMKNLDVIYLENDAKQNIIINNKKIMKYSEEIINFLSQKEEIYEMMKLRILK